VDIFEFSIKAIPKKTSQGFDTAISLMVMAKSSEL